MKEQLFEIWSEGYRATGEHGTATYHGSMRAATFKQACKRYAKQNQEFKKYFTSATMDFWGCRLYPTKEQASKSFG